MAFKSYIKCHKKSQIDTLGHRVAFQEILGRCGWTSDLITPIGLELRRLYSTFLIMNNELQTS
jgi:hypothetical protein